MQPKTLLQMAGVNPAPSKIADAAIVVIDAQREYIDGALPLVGIKPALDEIGRLLGRARKAGSPVIHVVHVGRPGGAFGPGSPGAEIAAPATPIEGETIVPKKLPNAFAGTDLAERLNALGRQEIILVGFQTHMCIEATARAALDLGFKATVVAAATATRDLPDAIGGNALSAAEVQRNALAAIADRFATVTPTTSAIPD
ncbi:MAG TPA: cysteine hydrolase family protein [Xanthobacteraceae bacterium]|jgi:nicotinamidase-related amidase|nr:cysteine hydrolase family protein [Xanthobacteraceae bacterium]